MNHDTSGRIVFVRFLEEIEDTKKAFRNQVTFIRKIPKNQEILKKTIFAMK